ncbi:MAG: RNA polymerase sigma factor [Ktedonobacterales bacterium]
MDDEAVVLAILLATDLDGHFSTLVQRYQEALYRFAFRLSNRPQEAEDIVQEAFLRSYVALSHYPAAHIRTLHLRPWLYKVALNVFRNSRRRVLSTCSLESDEANIALDMPDDEMTQPEIWLSWLERRQELEQALQLLAEHHREILICIYFEQLSYQEAATLLDITLGTVRSRVHRGLKALQSILSAEGKKHYEPA